MDKLEPANKPIIEWEFQVEKWTRFICDEMDVWSQPAFDTLKQELTNFRNAVIRSHEQTLRNKGLLTNEVSDK